MRDPIGASITDNQFLRADLDKLGLSPRARDTMERLPQDRDTLVQQINGVTEDLNKVEAEPILTYAAPVTNILSNTRQLLGSANVTFTVGASDGVLDLSDTGVVPGTVGDASHLVVLAIDAKGRVTSASVVQLNSDNVTEGTTNLFFTQARARASVNGVSGISYNSGTGVFTLDQSFTRGLLSGSAGVNYNSGSGAISLDASYARGLLSSGSGINYNAGSGVIATTGFSGTGAYTNFTFVNGVCTAAS